MAHTFRKVVEMGPFMIAYATMVKKDFMNSKLYVMKVEEVA